MGAQKITDHQAQRGRLHPPFVFHNVVAPKERVDDACKGAGPPNPQFFERLDQTGIIVAGWGLGEILFRAQFLTDQRLALFQRRHLCGWGRVPLVRLFLGQIIHLHKAGREQGASGRAEYVRQSLPGAGRVYIHGRDCVEGRFHLAGQKTPSDQRVEFVLIERQRRADGFRQACRIRGPNGFVRFLGIFDFALICGRARGERVRLVLLDHLPRSGLRFGIYVGTIRAHVGDQPHLPFFGQFHPFIKLLGNLHGFFRRPAQACRCKVEVM